MSSNMAIPAVNIGGNIVQPTPEGKIKVTTAKGKVKVLSQDQFVKQIKKNEQNIKDGKDFEIKKDNTGLKIAGLIAAAAAVAGGIVYRKDLAKLFKSAGEKVTEATSKLAEKVKGKGTNAKRYNDTLTAAEKNQLNLAKNHVDEFSNEAIEAAQKTRSAELAAMRADAESVFKNYDPDKALEYAAKKAEFTKMTSSAEKVAKAEADAMNTALKKAGLQNKAELDAVKLWADPKVKDVPENLPAYLKDKESCQRYLNSYEANYNKRLAELTKPETKPVPKAETPEVKAGSKKKTKKKTKKTTKKSEPKAETKPAATTEAKPKTESKAETKPEAKTEEKK